MLVSKNKKTVSSIMKSVKRGEMKLDHPCQRPSGIWTEDAKSLMIDSMTWLFLPAIVVVRKEVEGKKTEFVIDGKQRTSNFLEFVADSFAINDELIIKLPDGEEIDINGKKFSEIPEFVQELITNFDIDIITVTLEEEDDEQEIIDEIFLRLNNGSPVSKEHKAVVTASKEVQSFVQKMVAENPLFNVANFSKNAIKKSERELTVLHTLILFSGKEFESFSAKDTASFFKYAEIEPEVFERVDKAMTLLSSAFEEKEKMLSRVNIPIFTELTDDMGDVGEFLTWYVENTAVGDRYRSACSAGSVKKDKVQRRRSVIKDMYDKYVEENPATEE